MAELLAPWVRPWIRDFRGLNRSRPDAVDRGLSEPRTAMTTGEPREDAPRAASSHPARTRSVPDPEELLRREEQRLAGLQRALRDRARANSAQMSRAFPNLQAAARGRVPLQLVLGWVDKESSGQLGLVEHNAKDEIGWFQISIEERSRYLRLAPEARRAILEQPTFSAQQGVRLAEFYRDYMQSHFGMNDGSPAVWHLAKLMHKAGLPAVAHLIAGMRANGGDPSVATWRQFKLFAAGHPNRHLSIGEMSTVDEVMELGALHEAQLQRR